MARDRIHEYEPLWGSWNVDFLIGKGSFGSVYRVSREEMGRKYFAAVKIISIPSEEQYKEAEHTIGTDRNSLTEYFGDMVKSIANEIGVLYSLSGNSNIINYQDHQVIKRPNELGWDILIRMEYVTSLRDYQKIRQLKREEIIRLGIDICLALEVCSRKGIIHRDIKDENIFVNEDGVFKLGDFGISKELSGSSRAASMRGTPLYMAPEIYRGEKYDGRVDVYSLGMVLYKLFNHDRLPFLPQYPELIRFRDSEHALERRLNGDQFPVPDQAGNDLGQAILKACSFTPNDRHSSANEMRLVLENILNSMSESEKEEYITQKIESASFDSGTHSDSGLNQHNFENLHKTEFASNSFNKTESLIGDQKIFTKDKTASTERLKMEDNKGRKPLRTTLVLVVSMLVIIPGILFLTNYMDVPIMSGGIDESSLISESTYETYKFHKVRVNDSLKTLAAYYYGDASQENIDRIMRANKLTSDDVEIGDGLRIPITVTGMVRQQSTINSGVNLSQESKSSKNTPVNKYHTVRVNDSIKTLASYYYGDASQENVNKIMEANNLSNFDLEIGDRLIIPFN